MRYDKTTALRDGLRHVQTVRASTRSNSCEAFRKGLWLHGRVNIVDSLYTDIHCLLDVEAVRAILERGMWHVRLSCLDNWTVNFDELPCWYMRGVDINLHVHMKAVSTLA